MSDLLTRVTPPSQTPVDPAFVKERQPDLQGVDDDVLQSFIDAATQYLDGWTGVLGRALVTQAWRMDLAGWPCAAPQRLVLPLPPVQAVSAIQYYDAADVLRTFAPASYLFSAADQTIWLASGAVWPSITMGQFNAAQVTFVAGYGAPADVPAPIRTAIALMAGSMAREATRDAALTGENIPGVASYSWDAKAGSESMLSPAVKLLLHNYRTGSL